MMIRKHIVFYGQVQGVGFRYHARIAADTYGCTGWGRNERDGTVSMEIQGDEEAIGKVIQFLRQGTYIEIDDIDVKEIPVKPTDSRFRVEIW